MSFSLLDQAHQEYGFKMIRMGFENLYQTFFSFGVFLFLKINFRQQQSQFMVSRIVFESGLQKMQAFFGPIRDEQVIGFFNPESKLLSVRALVGVDDALHSVAKTIDLDRKSTRLNSSHRCISYAVFCL